MKALRCRVLEGLDALFPLRAPIQTDGVGLTRLELPAEVLRVCRPDLADLRILAADGAEVPYVVDNPAAPGVATRVRYGASPEVLDAARSRAVVDRVAIYREYFLLEIPQVPPDVPAWELVFDIAAREFVAALDVTAVDNGADFLVVGRPIRTAENPAAAAEHIQQEIAGALGD